MRVLVLPGGSPELVPTMTEPEPGAPVDRRHRNTFYRGHLERALTSPSFGENVARVRAELFGVPFPRRSSRPWHD